MPTDLPVPSLADAYLREWCRACDGSGADCRAVPCTACRGSGRQHRHAYAITDHGDLVEPSAQREVAP